MKQLRVLHKKKFRFRKGKFFRPRVSRAKKNLRKFKRPFVRGAYYRKILCHLINHIQKDGKKMTAFKIVKQFLLRVKDNRLAAGDTNTTKKNLQQEIIKFILNGVKRAQSILFLRKIHSGRKLKLVPLPLYQEKQSTFAIRQIVTSARSRLEKGMVTKLYEEFVDLNDSKKKPGSLKFKEKLYLLAVQNKKNTRLIRFLKTDNF